MATLQATDIDLAWAAGFFDGEGSVGIYPRTQYHHGKKYVGWRVCARLCGCNRVSVERFAEIVGNGVVRLERRKTKKLREVWGWRAYNAEVMTALERLLPYLVVKKEQVLLGIEFRSTVGNFGSAGIPADVMKRQTEMAALIKAMKYKD